MRLTSIMLGSAAVSSAVTWSGLTLIGRLYGMAVKSAAEAGLLIVAIPMLACALWIYRQQHVED